MLVFEGWDAAGKGGVIRRITSALDVGEYHLVPIAAPTDEEKAHHYLWRFWRRLPRAGEMVIFDRSWYGRVLVERVEGFAPEAAWRRAYEEINDFEENLTDRGFLVMKFWMHIDREDSCAASRSARRPPTRVQDHRRGLPQPRALGRLREAFDDMASTPARRRALRLVPANDKSSRGIAVSTRSATRSSAGWPEPPG